MKLTARILAMCTLRSTLSAVRAACASNLSPFAFLFREIALKYAETRIRKLNTRHTLADGIFTESIEKGLYAEAAQ